MSRIEIDELKELFAEWGLWSLVDDISPDGDGHGDNLQLTNEGLEAERMINLLLDDQFQKQSIEKWNQNERKKKDIITRKTLDNGFELHYANEPEKQEEWKESTKKEFYKQFGSVAVVKNEMSGNQYNSFWEWIEGKISQLLSERTFSKKELFMLKLAVNDIYNNGNNAYEGISKKISKLLKEE